MKCRNVWAQAQNHRSLGGGASPGGAGSLACSGTSKSERVNHFRRLRSWGAAAAIALGILGAAPAVQAQTVASDPINELRKAAGALGGLERIQSVKNITLNGYGQYAYMFGAGTITGSQYAPQKFEGAFDLHRIYDLEHSRYQQLERRSFLFPFAIAAGHDLHQINESLDGDIAFNVRPDGSTQRLTRWKEDAHQVDGIHMRRMWSLCNPVALVRAALDPTSKLSNMRNEGGDIVMDVTLRQGDHFSLALAARSSLPDWIRWTNPQTNLGQITLTTRLTGYTPHEGLMLPLGYTTYMDWRNIPYLKIYVDSYDVDGKIADISAPASVRGPEPMDPALTVTSQSIVPGIWRLEAGAAGSTAFEFSDHITLFELNSDQRSAQAIIDFARKLVPSKPVTQLIVSHAHFDHVAGIRAAVANGLTVIARRNNEGVLREQVTHPAPDFPDALALHPVPMKFIPVDEHLRLSDKEMTLDVYWARDNIHMADALFAYAPKSRVMAEADIATAAYDFQWWPDNYMDNLEYYKLQVDFLSPVHSIWPAHPGVLTHAQVIELIKGGVARTRAWCAEQLAKGIYFTGCPVHSKRY